MQYGVVFPQTEFPPDPILIRDFAQEVEGLGFKHILAYDHVLGANPDRPGGWRGPYTHEHSFYEPFVLFSYMAGVTESLGFATGVIILPQRQTALVAKQAATLDVLCEGRLRVGIGVGWNEVEYIALGEAFGKRGKKVEEQIDLLLQLWTDPLVEFEGDWHTVPDAGLNPMPVQRPIPLWFGGHADVVLGRLARSGAGWMPSYRQADDAKEKLNTLSALLEEEDRTLNDIGIDPRLRYGDGNPDTWKQQIEEWEKVGATHISFLTLDAGMESVATHLDALRKFATLID